MFLLEEMKRLWRIAALSIHRIWEINATGLRHWIGGMNRLLIWFKTLDDGGFKILATTDGPKLRDIWNLDTVSVFCPQLHMYKFLNIP
jgi:hypothetical protein